MKQSRFRGFWRHNGGNVAIMFALMLLPVATVVAFAIDTSRHVTAARVLQEATDIAALAAAKTYALTGDYDQSVVEARLTFNVNISNTKQADVHCTANSYAIDHTTGDFSLTTKCRIPTIFGVGITGASDMFVHTAAKATGSVTTLDLALVVDVSHSMAGSRLRALQAAANNLIDQLATADENVRIAIIPYSGGVNAGIYGNPALDRPAGDDTEGDGVDRVCVSERGGAEAFTDAPVGAGTYAGEPTYRTRGCPVQPIVPLSNDPALLKTAIGNLAGSGYSSGQIAVGWAWYLISPEWASFWPTASRPRAYGNPDELKVMVLMTDGAFNLRNIFGHGTPNQMAQKLCEGMRAKGIIVFTVAFQAPESAQTLMQNCASSAGNYFEASDEHGLSDAYASIASRFKGVGLIE